MTKDLQNILTPEFKYVKEDQQQKKGFHLLLTKLTKNEYATE